MLPERSSSAVTGSRARLSARLVAQTQPFLSLSPRTRRPNEMPLEHAADELAMLPTLRPGELRAELVQLPALDGDSCGARVADRVAIAASHLDAPGDSLGGREPHQADSSGTRPANRRPTLRSSAAVSVRRSQASVRTSALNIGE